MADRTATTTWEGNLTEGSGRTELVSSKLGTFDVSWPNRGSEEAEGATSPEELIAAAHTACFSMALAKQVADAGGTPERFETSAVVTLTLEPLHISKVALTVRGHVDGIDEAAFRQAAEAAKEGCPVSQLIAGNTELTLDASLA